MIELLSQDKELIFDVYGHSLTTLEIKKKYPYENKRFSPRKYKKLSDTRITYDPHIALQLKSRGIPCLVWGRKTRSGQRAFAFRTQSDPVKIEF